MGVTDEAQTAAAILGHNYPDIAMVPGRRGLAEDRGLTPLEHTDFGFRRSARGCTRVEPARRD